MVLIVLTERNPADAIRAMFARLTNIVVPLSVLFIKYWPNLGRYYHQFTWTPGYSGVATEKNALGAVAFICGLYIVWDHLVFARRAAELSAQVDPPPPARIEGRAPRPSTRARSDRDPASPRIAASSGKVDLLVQATLLCMVLWLVYTADSTNALLCLVFGSAVVFVTRRSARGSQKLLKNFGRYASLLILATLILYFTPTLKESVLEFLGEDVTLTGRTAIWQDVLEEPNNLLLGAGYESFWQQRSLIERLWVKYPFHPNQAHNAYIETYLNGGWIGLILILMTLIAAAVRIKRDLVERRPESFLLAAFFFTATVYCWSEAMFGKMSPIWVVLLLAIVKAPRSVQEASARLSLSERDQRWQPTR